MGSLSALPALDLKTPQQPDLLEKYSQLQQLKGMQQQQDIRAQQAPLQQQQLEQGVQSGGLQIQQQQQGLKDQQAMTAAMQQWDGKSLSDLPPLVLKNGGSATAVMGLKEKQLAMTKQYSDIAASDATTGSKNIETMKNKGDLITGALAPLVDPTQTPDAQLSQALQSTVQDLAQKGLLDPQHAQAADQLLQSNDPNAIRQGIDQFRKTFMAQSQILDQAKQDATESNRQQMRDQAAANAKQTQLNENRAAGQRQQGINIEGARLNFEKQKQANDTGNNPDGTPSNLAASIAHGHIPLDRMGYLLARNPQLIQGVMQVDPSFDGSKAQSYPQTYKDFTSGKTSIAINAGGTVLQHLQHLQDLNTVESRIPGTAAYQAYQNQLATIAPELGKFYGNDTIPGIEGYKKTLGSIFNRGAAIQTQAQSMGVKLDSFQQQWENAAPSKAYEAPMPGISAKAMKARAALDPNYKAPQAASQASQQGGNIPKVGDVVSVGGRKVKVTSVDPSSGNVSGIPQ